MTKSGEELAYYIVQFSDTLCQMFQFHDAQLFINYCNKKVTHTVVLKEAARISLISGYYKEAITILEKCLHLEEEKNH